MHEEIIILPQRPDDPFQLQITGISYCDGSYRIERAASDVHCLEYIVSGTGTVHEDGRRFTASAGDVYLLHRGRRQLYYSDGADPWTKLWLNVYGPLPDRLIELYGLGEVCHIPQAGGMEAPFRAFVEHARRKRDGADDGTPEAILFHDILRRLSALADDHPLTLAEKIRREIDSAPDYNISIEEAARRLFCSKSHAIKVFREAFGVTPHEYILRRKMELAATLLKNSAMPVGQIAEQLGFCDSHYFSGVFRARMGVPPSGYRKN